MKTILMVLLLFSASAMADDSLKDTFAKIAKGLEAQGCPGDFVKPVADLISRVCSDARNGADVEPVSYLKDTSDDAPQLFCSYDDGIYELMVGDTSDQPTASQVKFSISESGQITEITKDALKVEGSTCRDLAKNLEKGGRIPASIDTELCFDYYPTNKFMASREQTNCAPAKKTKVKGKVAKSQAQ